MYSDCTLTTLLNHRLWWKLNKCHSKRIVYNEKSSLWFDGVPPYWQSFCCLTSTYMLLPRLGLPRYLNTTLVSVGDIIYLSLSSHFIIHAFFFRTLQILTSPSLKKEFQPIRDSLWPCSSQLSYRPFTRLSFPLFYVTISHHFSLAVLHSLYLYHATVKNSCKLL